MEGDRGDEDARVTDDRKWPHSLGNVLCLPLDFDSRIWHCFMLHITPEIKHVNFCMLYA